MQKAHHLLQTGEIFNTPLEPSHSMVCHGASRPLVLAGCRQLPPHIFPRVHLHFVLLARSLTFRHARSAWNEARAHQTPDI